MLRTKSGLPKHVTFEVDRHGKRRARFRRGSVSVYLTGIPWSEDFLRQYGAALERVQTARSTIGANKRSLPGSFSALCVDYILTLNRSRQLKPGTKAERFGVLERFRSKHGHRLVKDLHRVHVQNILDAKVDETGPESANNLLKALRLILDFAVHKGLIAGNPAHGLKRYKSQNPDGHHMWSEDEIARYEAVHPLDSRAGLALALLVYTGQRRGDILGMGWQHVQGGSHIVIRQQKTGVAATIPIHPKLALALAALSKTNLTFLVTTRGTPFSTGGFNHWFRRMCGAAGLPPECTPHGLRKSALTRLGEAGCSVLQIAAISGHKSLREVQRYTEGADKRRLADQAMAMQLRAEGEQSLPAIPTHALPKRK